MAYQLPAWTLKYVQNRIAAIATSSEEFGEQRLRLISGVKVKGLTEYMEKEILG
jgi:hypothetical protein